MRPWCRALLLAVLAVQAAAVPTTALPLPEGTAFNAPAASELMPAVSAYNTWIGGYPTRLKDEAQRTEVYQRWSETLRQARAFHAQVGDTADALWALAALYRMGHNMDVKDCGANAEKFIELGLAKYPDSIALNFEASYFYLSADPKYAPRGEAALLRLRQLKGTDRDLEIERGLVFAYLYQNRIPEAKKQVEHYLKLKPGDKMMLQMREGLKRPVEHKQGPPPDPKPSQ